MYLPIITCTKNWLYLFYFILDVNSLNNLKIIVILSFDTLFSCFLTLSFQTVPVKSYNSYNIIFIVL